MSGSNEEGHGLFSQNSQTMSTKYEILPVEFLFASLMLEDCYELRIAFGMKGLWPI